MDYEQMVAKLAKMLTPKRLRHSVGVSETAEELAGIFGCDRGKARVAGLLHDVAREIPVGELLSRAEAFGIVMSDIERAEPILLHASIAARLAHLDFCIDDDEIFQAICLHTVGGLHMSLLDKIIYVADAIEPGRQFEKLEEIREIARIDLDKALLMTLDQNIQYILKRGGLLHPATIEARNELLTMLRTI